MSVPFILAAVRIELVKIGNAARVTKADESVIQGVVDLVMQLDDIIKDSKKCPPPDAP